MKRLTVKVPARQRAVEAIAPNPGKSNRMIAEEIGVAEGTVRTARKSTAQHYAVEKRIGKDGKVRHLPARSAVMRERN